MAEKTLIAAVVGVVCHAHTGYRRAGLALNKGQNTFKAGSITSTQLAQLDADPRLKVTVAESALSGATLDDAASGDQSNQDVVDDAIPASLVEAIARLDPSNTEHFTASGKPTTEALSELMQTKVSAAERDQAWEEVQESNAPLDDEASEPQGE